MKDKRKEVIEKLKDKKKFNIFYQFSDVVDTIEATNEEEARHIANEILINSKGNKYPQNNTYCYHIDIEEEKD